jgi:hypothetical protein
VCRCSLTFVFTWEIMNTCTLFIYLLSAISKIPWTGTDWIVLPKVSCLQLVLSFVVYIFCHMTNILKYLCLSTSPDQSMIQEILSSQKVNQHNHKNILLYQPKGFHMNHMHNSRDFSSYV